jgi:hypothetical protein
MMSLVATTLAEACPILFVRSFERQRSGMKLAMGMSGTMLLCPWQGLA